MDRSTYDHLYESLVIDQTKKKFKNLMIVGLLVKKLTFGHKFYAILYKVNSVVAYNFL